ncbi:metal-dependent hydrolase [Fodinibius sp. Rm-B-1B1-1]|uniref:metal-dependent hydrolase n=1 Tax=Fodinibius alkaliphilus TaxID=3140241 RepID=UPI00315B3ACD
MDPVTHGLIGASASQSASTNDQLWPASLIGLVSAMLADLDVFITSASDPLLNIELHRQFSHSLIFIPIGALIATVLLWYFLRHKLTFRQIYGFSLLGYATAGLTDTLTSYGTKLYWPFVDDRFAWNLMSVFDPLFSAGIFACVAITLYKKNPRISWLVWGWIALYLSMAIIQQQRAKQVAQSIAQQQGHTIDRLVVKPTLGNQLLWSIRYIHQDTLYAHGVQLGLSGNSQIYDGESAPLLNWKRQYAPFRGTTLYQDIKRFDKLSEGFLIKHPHEKNVIGDGRYAMLPTRMSPLWGIKIDSTNPDKHLPFKTFRESTSSLRSTYLNMILGKENP